TTIMMTTGAITLAAAATPVVATATVVAEVAMVRAASNLTPASKAVVKEAKTVISKCKESTVVSTAAIITIINAISTWVVRMTRTAAIGGTKMTAKVCRAMAVKANMAIAD